MAFVFFFGSSSITRCYPDRNSRASFSGHSRPLIRPTQHSKGAVSGNLFAPPQLALGIFPAAAAGTVVIQSRDSHALCRASTKRHDGMLTGARWTLASLVPVLTPSDLGRSWLAIPHQSAFGLRPRFLTNLGSDNLSSAPAPRQNRVTCPPRSF